MKSKKKNKIKTVIIVIILLIVMSVSGVYALTESSKLSTENTFSTTNGVDIELAEYLNSEEYNVEQEEVEPGIVRPISAIVENRGMDAYLRIKINLLFDNVKQEDISSCVTLNSNLEKVGDYYYLKDIFKSKDIETIFDSINIPNNTNVKERVELQIIAQAIQSENFTPDYNKTDPWENQVIKEKKIGIINNPDEEEDIKIIYEGDADKDVNISDTFFKDVDKLVPGSEVVEKVKITNSSKEPEKYYLNLNLKNFTQSERKLLKNIKFYIKQNNNILLENNLSDITNLNITNLKKGEEKDIELVIEMPKELDNDYSKIVGKLEWKFTKEKDEPLVDKITDKVVDTIANPNTGDKINISLTIFVLSAISLIIILYKDKKSNVKNFTY